ncbi:calmodulin-binding transcription activator 2-like isoform X2 [Cynara cardunculus var. scolymus]|uniref:calmodulin-binding transcription activator 2-like isoform X2 n=1 Tax=Cynara cardunculus var. scolymus TaxID=59895 RepID=UPI000D62A43E|nr:calmodulin-binding transcription activator 2-like isoform X2 [Cynara cardunculus var. scolymus]
MAETKCYIPNQLLDLDQIQQEAQHRWLRPAEICEILTNYHKFQLRTSPPANPPAGSLFLFDRKVLRYFRKDGHRWRKKKDGKIVKEAHEKLKAGSVDVLHCYYAHGEDNDKFQRRSYWMLDKRFENIVLVHYREVKEGYKSGSPHVLNADSGSLLQSSESSLSPGCCHASVDRNEQSASSRLNDGQSFKDVGISSLDQPNRSTFHADREPFHPVPDSSTWTNFNGSARDTITADVLSYKLTEARLDVGSHSHDFLNGLFPDPLQVHAGFEAIDTSAVNCSIQNDDAGGLKKLDSFGRWMDKEMGGDCEDSLLAANSGNYWNALETENDRDQASSLTHHMQLNTDSVGPSLAKEQQFSILDFAPDWAYSGTETKVLIAGTFVGDKKRWSEIKWCCMFGEIEVPAELVTENTIRCQVPFHAAQRVPFYITCGNRLACSEVREFEYVEKPAEHPVDEDELVLMIRLSKLLSSLGIQRKWLGCSMMNCEKCKLKDVICSLVRDKERSWKRITEAFKGNSEELLIQNLLKDKLYEQLLPEAHETCQGLRMLDEKGQGVIHLVSALGYEWAVGPIVAAGVSSNFRDARGRTALHWASLYGREETVVALVKLGAFAGAVDDPTGLNPGGQTAADLASSKGHKGIAGYLAEEDLTSHLSALSVNGGNSAVANGDKEHSLRGSVAAVRRSVHAAALIQDAFRARSFRQRQVSRNMNEELVALATAAAASSSHKVQKRGEYEDYLQVAAASRIQQKYRGWKGRNDFLKIRERIVKIQAHFRGHQVRKHYKKVVWSVGIVEKAILRWRRKSRGLRGFRVGKEEAAGEYDFLRIGRRQKYVGVEKALARVQSMARHPEAQEQYMRLVEKMKRHEEDR